MTYMWHYVAILLYINTVSGYKTYSTAVNKYVNVKERAIKDGYSSSQHTVETEDGYVLTLFRIRRAGGITERRPILLMHGLLLSAATWSDAGVGTAPAYLLADSGRDVWLANVRGTHYSRRHVYLDPDSHAFWQFSVDEIGLYDIPAFLDYILSHTGVDKLDYIGFSQGCGVFFVMCSERPEYQEKVNVMIALAPSTRHLHTKSILFRMICKFYQAYENDLHVNGVWEALSRGGPLQTFIELFCSISNETAMICEFLKDGFDASNPGSILPSTLRVATTGLPAGTSVHSLAKYGQMLDSKRFQKFDHGPEQNMAVYGRRTPPEYNLSSVMVSTVVLYGRNDGIVDERDVKWLLKKLPNVVEAYEVEDPLWTHLDMTISKNIPTYIMPKIFEYLDHSSTSVE